MYGKAKEIVQVADKYFHDIAQPVQILTANLDIFKIRLAMGNLSREEMLSNLEVMAKAAENTRELLIEARNVMHGKEMEAKILNKYTKQQFFSYLTGHISPAVQNYKLTYNLGIFNIDENKILHLNESLYNQQKCMLQFDC
jgi:hypothetical protein